MSADIGIDSVSQTGSQVHFGSTTHQLCFSPPAPGSSFHDSLCSPLPLGMKAQPNTSCLYTLLVKRHKIPDDGWKYYHMRNLFNQLKELSIHCYPQQLIRHFILCKSRGTKSHKTLLLSAMLELK